MQVEKLEENASEAVPKIRKSKRWRELWLLSCLGLGELPK